MKYIDPRTRKSIAVDASTIFYLEKKNTNEFYINAIQSSPSLLNTPFFNNLFILKIETRNLPLFRFDIGYDQIFPRDVLRQEALTKDEVKDYLKTDTTNFEDVEARPHVIQESDYLAYRSTIWAKLPKIEAHLKSQSDSSLYLRFKGI